MPIRGAILCVTIVIATSMGVASSTTAAVQSDVLSRSTLTEEQRVLGLSRLWAEARFSFGYFDTIAAGWDDRYQTFLPAVRAAKTDYDYYLELMRFYAALRDGHSGVFWPAAFDDALGYPPFEIRKIDGRAVIFRILTDTPEITANAIKPGLAIVSVDGRPVQELVDHWRSLKTASTEQATDRLAYFRILTGRRGTPVDVQLQAPDGTTRSVRLTRSEKYFNDTNLTPPRQFVSRAPANGIGYFQANQMSQAAADGLAAYVAASSSSMQGLVLDFRYNGGGSDLTGFDMVSRLIDQRLDGPIYEVTSYQADRRAVRSPPQVVRTSASPIAPANGPRFTGWIAVLIGEQTHSAAESGFLAVMRARPKTVFVGESTAGSTGQPLTFALPGGGIGAVCSRRTVMPDGRSFVGTGFTPDVAAKLTADDLWAGRDRVLETAMGVLNERLGR